MQDNNTFTPEPYQFGKALFKPFFSGPKSFGFVMKSALLFALVCSGLVFIFGPMMVDPMKEYLEFAVKSSQDGAITEPEEILQIYRIMAKALLPYLGIWLITWVVWAMIEAALHRRVLREDYGGIFPFRFGKDELWVMLSQLILYFTYMALYVVVELGLLVAVLAGVFIGGNGGVIGVIGMIFAGLFLAAALFVMFFVLIKLSPTAALSVAKKEFAIGEAWGAVKGRFWPTFWAYALLYIVGMGILYVIWIGVGVAFVGTLINSDLKPGADAATESEQLFSVISQIFSKPGVRSGLMIGMFLTLFYWGVWMQLSAGIMSHVSQLYLRDKDKKNASVFS